MFLTKHNGIISEIERLVEVADNLRKQKHSGVPGNSPLQVDYQLAIVETLEAIKRLARQIPKEDD
jgi:hypothetical protein